VTAALPLGVRNRLAELILSAFADAEARATLEALGRFCASPDGRLDEDAAARLRPLGWFEPGGRTSLRLTGAHRPYQDALCRRAAAAVAMLGPPSSAPSGDTLVGRLARAARLADAGLHFEVHELLEPAWLRAEGAERIALQGLIQAAVALHHASHDNRAGAIALLGEGLAKLEAAGRALPLDIAGWMEGLASILTAWRTGVAAPTAPPWPAPSEAAWRSS
jgi:hypothetical protein